MTSPTTAQPTLPAKQRAVAGIPSGPLIAGLAVLGLIAVLAALLVLRGPAPAFPAGSPEAAVEDYLTAVAAEDLETAYASFSSDVQSRVSVDEYRRMAYGSGWAWSSQDVRRVRMQLLTGSGERRTMELQIEHGSSDPLFGGRWVDERRVPLVQEADGWRIDMLLIGLEPAEYFEPGLYEPGLYPAEPADPEGG